MPNVPLFYYPPENPDDFEQLCKRLFAKAWDAPDLKEYHRRGGDQGGVDMLGTAADGSICAVQSKRRDFNHRLDRDEVADDVRRACAFRPRIARFAVATTAKRQADLQRYFVRRNQLHLRRRALCSVEVYFWDDLNELLNAHEDVAGSVYGPTVPVPPPAVDPSVTDAVGQWLAHGRADATALTRGISEMLPQTEVLSLVNVALLQRVGPEAPLGSVCVDVHVRNRAEFQALLRHAITRNAEGLADTLRSLRGETGPPVVRAGEADAVIDVVLRRVAALVLERRQLYEQFTRFCLDRYGPDARAVIALLSAFGEAIGHLVAGLDQVRSEQAANKDEILRAIRDSQHAAASLRSDSRSAPGAAGGDELRRRALIETIDQLHIEVRQHLDEEGRRLWECIRRQFLLENFRDAVSSAAEVEAWLGGKGSRASPGVRGQLYVLAAELAVLRQHVEQAKPRVDTGLARRLYAAARDAFGPSLSEEDAARLASLGAKLDVIDGRHEAALDRLGASVHPVCVLRRLTVLIELERFEEAEALIEAIPLDERWCAEAVFVWRTRGRHDRVSAVLHDARSFGDDVWHDRCLLAVARAALRTVVRGISSASAAVHPEDVDEVGVRELRDAMAQLQPLLARSDGVRRPGSGLEVEALSLACTIAYLASDPAAARTFATRLAGVSPVPIEYARAVSRGHVAPEPELPARLRADHPRSFDACFLAAVIEGEMLGRPADALDAARGLAGRATTDGERLDVCDLLRELAELCGPSEVESIGEDIRRLLGRGHRYYRFWVAETQLHRGDLGDAQRVIEELRDDADPLWLQFWALLNRRRGHLDVALDALSAAGRLLPRPNLLKRIAAAAREAGRWEVAADALERLLSRGADEAPALHDLSTAYWNLQDFGRAARCFRRLSEVDPRDASHRLNYAIVLALDGKVEESLQELRDGAGSALDTLHAKLARADLFHRLGEPTLGFGELDAASTLYWDDPTFLTHFTNLAYASGRDDRAEQAFGQLLQLRRLGRVDDGEYVREATFDELVEMHRQHAAHAERVADLVLRGQCPWLLADDADRTPAYAAWWLRTRDRVVYDSPLDRANGCVYSTNGFTVSSDGASERSLEPIVASPARSAVVADLSALITLHRLGLLDAAASLFGQVLVPADYVATLLQQGVRLRTHQPSRLASARAVVEAVEAGRVRISHDDGLVRAGPASPINGPLWLRDHEDVENRTDPAYDLGDLREWLAAHGLVSEDQLSRLPDRPRARPSVMPPFDEAIRRRGLVAELETLRTLHDAGLLDVAVRSGLWFISPSDLAAARGELATAAERERLGRWNQALVKRLSSDARFVRCRAARLPTGGQPPAQSPDKDTASRRPALAALLLAKERRLPLLADDRWCQTNGLGALEPGPLPSFGVDSLLAKLVRKRHLKPKAAAEAYLQLVRWRYRFLVPPVWVLTELAAAYGGGRCGPLNEMARYAHDCMRDPGLFAGQEQTDPPMSMALRLYMSWGRLLADFVHELWTDRRFRDDGATALTEWAARECLPSPPRSMPLNAQLLLSENGTGATLAAAFTRVARVRDWQRLNRGLVAYARALGISDDRYAALVCQVIQTAQNYSAEDAEILQPYWRVVVRNALGHLNRLDARAAMAFDMAGLGVRAPSADPPEPDTSVVLDAEHPLRLRDAPGPLVAFRRSTDRGEQNGSVVETLQLLDFPSVVARRAAVTELRRHRAEGPEASLSPYAADLLASSGDAACSPDMATWVSAASAIAEAVRGDFLFNLAGFAQVKRLGLTGDVQRFWEAVIRPLPASLLSLHADGYRWLTTGEAVSKLAECVDGAATFVDALDRYEDVFGHLPLARPFSAAAVLERWKTKRGITGSDFAAFWGWALRPDRPVRQYHLCSALLGVPEAIPEADRPRYWHALARVMTPRRPRGGGGSDDDLRRADLLLGHTVRANLAKHYYHYLQAEAPTYGHDRLACLAWWASERVARELIKSGNAGDRLRELRRAVRLLRPLSLRSEFLWRLAPPPETASVAATLVRHAQPPWAAALACSLPEDLSTLRPDAADPEDLERVTRFFVASLLVDLPPVNCVKGSIPWAFDTAIIPAARAWAEAAREPHRPGSFGALLTVAEARHESGHLDDLLKGLVDGDEPQQRLFAQSLLARCLAGELDSEVVWKRLCEPGWRASLLSLSSETTMSTVFGALTAIQRRNGGKWAEQLPHLWADAALDENQHPRRKRLFIGFSFLAAAASAGGSSATRLAASTDPLIVAELERWRAGLPQWLSDASAWTVARGRDLRSQINGT